MAPSLHSSWHLPGLGHCDLVPMGTGQTQAPSDTGLTFQQASLNLPGLHGRPGLYLLGCPSAGVKGLTYTLKIQYDANLALELINTGL